MIKRRHIATMVTTVGILGKLGIASAVASETVRPPVSPALGPASAEHGAPGMKEFKTAAATRHGDDGGDDGDNGGDD